MKLYSCFLGALLLLRTEQASLSYGSANANYNDAPVDGQKNHLCNGDFEDPPLPAGKEWTLLDNSHVPCWVGTKNMIQIGFGQVFVDGMQTQVMELATDGKIVNQGFKQLVNLTKGTYLLKFDFAPRKLDDPEVSMFYVYFNSQEIAKFRPSIKQIQTSELTVEGIDGENVLEFVDATTITGQGAVIDNVGIYRQKRSQVMPKEVDAVSAGGVVTMSTVWDENCNMYQLDNEGVGLEIGSWCAKNNLVGNWIQVATESLKLWNSVIIQGRNSYTHRQRVTKFKLMYSVDGFVFRDYNNGQEFAGNTDQTTKVRHNLEPFYALAIRLYPLQYVSHMSLRWGATYIVEE